MLYKEKILLLHRNSLIQERISVYLRENDFAVIMANNVDNALSLLNSMKPDLILWGESLTAHSKSILKKIKEDSYGATVPVIALIPDVELFDRIEIEKSGINDILEASPHMAELKVKIRFHLMNRARLKKMEEHSRHLKELSELQYNLIRVQDVQRLCELVNDYIFNIYSPDTLISLVFNSKTNDYDYTGLLTAEPPLTENRQSVFELPVWKKYFRANPKMEAEQIVDSYMLEFFRNTKLAGDVFYQFPMQTGRHQIGFLIVGFTGAKELSKPEIDELGTLAQSLAYRIVNNRHTGISKHTDPEQTQEIQQFFKMIDEEEIANYLSLQLLSHLKADMSIYFNYNEGFRFLYPQYCYKAGSDQNLFENEKPPVLMLKDFPTIENFLEAKLPSAHFNLNENPVEDLMAMSKMAGGVYQSILLFAVHIGNELKGFFIVANEQSRKLFTNKEIQSAEQTIQKATNVLVESRLIKQAQKTIKQLDRVFELGKELTLNIEVDELLKKIGDSVRRTLGWNVVIIDRRKISGNKFQNVCALGIKRTDYDHLRNMYPDKLFANWRNNCFHISQSCFFDHESMDEPVNNLAQRRFLSSIGKEWDDRDWLIVPVLSKGKELGYIAVNDPVERVRPNEEKVRSLEYFANQAAVALENARLYSHLKVSEEKYRLLAETMTMGLVTCDYSGKIIYVNQSLLDMLKYSDASALIGQNIYDLCSIRTRGEVEKYILKLFKSDSNEKSVSSDGVEIELLSNSGSHIPFKLYVTANKNLSNEQGFIGVLADLRPQRRLERMKTDFNSMVVHDLRSPLNIIQGYIDIVRNNVVGEISEEQAELLQIAKDNVDKVLKLVDNFMIASKIDAGKFAIEMEIHSINALIEAVYEQNLILAQKKNITLSIDLDHSISMQQFDRLRIEQVLSNYLSNALKFTPNGGKITIFSKLVKTSNELTGEETMEVHVGVKDTGVGVPYEEQSKVFSKYEQTEAGKDASLKGTGLGLAICKEIISMHNGEVWLESKPSEGSTFYFSLPIQPIQI